MKSLVFCLTFLGLVTVGTAVKCFVCNNGDPNCGETMSANSDDTTYVQDCPNTNGCMKIDATHVGTGIKSVTRKCFYTMTPQSNKCKVYTHGQLQGVHCMCLGDFCNAGNEAKRNLVLIGLSVAAATLLRSFV